MKKFEKLILLTLFIINVNPISAQTPKTKEGDYVTHITGKLQNGQEHDTLTLVLHGPYFSYGRSPEWQATHILTTNVNANGDFKFNIISGNSPFHISLFLSSKRKNGILLGPGDFSNGDINNYLIDAGDSVHVVFDKNGPYFTGKGASIFDAQYQTEKIDKDGIALKKNTDNYFAQNKKIWLKLQDSILQKQLSLLATYQSKLSPTSYAIVRADVIGFNRYFVYSPISFIPEFYGRGKALDNDLAALYNELEQEPLYIDQNDRAALSPKYINYLYERLNIDIKYQRLINNIDVRLDYNYFSAINKQYKGILRDKLLVLWLRKVASVNHLLPEYIDSTLSVMITPVFIDMVNDLKTTFSKGQPITDFAFKDPKGKTVYLNDFKGKVVFVDLWFSGCTGCLAVAAGLPSVEEAFNGRSDVIFVSVSIDKDRKTWLKSIDKNTLATTHYRHFTTHTTRYLYTAGTGGQNPFIRKYVPDGSYPSLLIIGKDGKVYSSTPSRPVSATNKLKLINELNTASQQHNFN